MYEGPLRTNVKSVKTSILVLAPFPRYRDFYVEIPTDEGGTAVQGHPRSSILVLMESL